MTDILGQIHAWLTERVFVRIGIIGEAKFVATRSAIGEFELEAGEH